MSQTNDPDAACVLLADDSPVARLAIARRLRAEGFHVIEAGSAEEAIVRARDVTMTCALLDLDLGDGDGSDVATALRRAHADLPIAFFSATAASDDVARATAIGPVFAKPHQLDDAIAWVEGHAVTGRRA